MLNSPFMSSQFMRSPWTCWITVYDKNDRRAPEYKTLVTHSPVIPYPPSRLLLPNSPQYRWLHNFHREFGGAVNRDRRGARHLNRRRQNSQQRWVNRRTTKTTEQKTNKTDRPWLQRLQHVLEVKVKALRRMRIKGQRSFQYSIPLFHSTIPFHWFLTAQPTSTLLGCLLHF